MKRYLSLTMVFLLIMVCQLFAAGSSSRITDQQNYIERDDRKKVITISWVADNTTGSVPNLTIDVNLYGIEGWYLYSAETNPGTTAPTDNYDIVINDTEGVDIAGSLLNNRDETNTELVLIGTASHGFPVVKGNLTFSLSNNSVNSATGTLILIFISN